jgi:fructuronate reductase
MTPAYDRDTVMPGIVHLGLGAFHRAHQAVYVDDCIAVGETDWGIIGASLRSADTRDALLPQEGLYHVVVRSGDQVQPRVIGSVLDMLVAPEDPQALLDAMSDSRIRIVSLTITEKGYCHDPATGQLNAQHPDIIHDLSHPDRPRSAPGYIVAALRLRRAANIPAFTVLCCDNLPANGHTVRSVVEELARLQDPSLGDYIAENVAFPCTMVDRIVPSTTDVDRAEVATLTGVEDRWPVMTEPFSQWVIEDQFCNGRPSWDRHGVQMVKDVAPFELMKLRLLNGSHSTIAYLGFLAGHQTVAETVADPAFARLIEQLMEQEMRPTLTMPDGVDLDAYSRQLMQRFANTSLKHRTQQIAMDGSQKLPQRLIAPARERLAKGQSIHIIATAIAGWIRYTMGIDEAGNSIEIRDPMAAQFAAITSTAGRDATLLTDGYLQLSTVFGTDLPQNATFRSSIITALESLLTRGAAATVAAAG